MPEFNMPMQNYDGWNVNQSYMTPAYMANFRPAYHNPAGNNPYANHYSVGESLWRGMGPGSPGPYGSDTQSQISAHRYNIASSGFDAGMTGMQYLGAPALALAGAHYSGQAINRAMGGAGSGLGATLGAGIGGYAGRTAASMGGWAARRMGMGAVASGLGAMGAGAGMGVAGAAVGGLAGAFMGAPLIGAGLASGYESTVSDPYIATRRGMDAMRANTANQFISGGGKSATGGYGMSATQAQKISSKLTEAGQKDFVLSAQDYNEVADNLTRGGLFAEIGDMDVDKIVDGTKAAISVLKLASRVTGDPDIKSALNTGILSQLKSGGMDDFKKMGVALKRMQNDAAASGTSVNQIMGTVGSQGMVMAQQHGLTGATGMLASSDAFAGFTNARRAGVISGAQMASLGGAEGMTQNVMSGAYGIMDSTAGRMALQGGGGFSGSLMGSVNQWSDKYSGSPLRAEGDWILNKGKYKDDALKGTSASRLSMDAIRQQARASGVDDKDGLALAAFAKSKGMSEQEIRSTFEAERATQDPRSAMRRRESRRTAERADFAASLEQEGLGASGLVGLGTAQESYAQFKSTMKGGTSGISDTITGAMADVSDAWESMSGTGTHMLERPANASTYMKTKSGDTKRYRLQGRTGKSSVGNAKTRKYDDILKKLNNVAKDLPGGEAKAQELYAAIESGDEDKVRRLTQELDTMSKGAISGSTNEIKSGMYAENVASLVGSGNITASSEDVPGSTKAVEKFNKEKYEIGVDDYQVGGSDNMVNGIQLGQDYGGFLESSSALRGDKDKGEDYSSRLDEAKKMLMSDDPAERQKAVEIYRKLDKDSGGKLSQGGLNFYQMEEDIKEGRFGVRRSDSSKSKEKAFNKKQGEMEKDFNDKQFTEGLQDRIRKETLGLSGSDASDKTLDIVNENRDEFARVHGIDLSANDANSQLGDAANALGQSVSEDRGVVKDEADFRERLRGYGVSGEQYNAYSSAAGIDNDEQVDNLDGLFGLSLDDTDSKIRSIAEKAKKHAETGQLDDSASTVDFSGMEDIGRDIGKLTPATNANTTALNKLTKVLERAEASGGSVNVSFGNGNTVKRN